MQFAANIFAFCFKVWDDYLAGQAQNIANTCDYGHKEVEDSKYRF